MQSIIPQPATPDQRKKTQEYNRLSSLLLGHTDSTTSTTGCLRVLSTNTESPVVTKTTMSADLLQAFQIVTELGVNTVGKNLAVFAIDDITLTIEEPGWDLVLSWVLDNGDDSLKFFGGKFTGAVTCQFSRLSALISCSIPLGEIDISLLADQVRVTASDTLYFCEGKLFHRVSMLEPQTSQEGLIKRISVPQSSPFHQRWCSTAAECAGTSSFQS